MKRRRDFQLVVRKLESEVVDALRTRAARKGHSMEAEHRDILRAALRPAPAKTSFKEWLLKMPDVGTDKDFARNHRPPRPVRL
jgi:antitoxin FitA